MFTIYIKGRKERLTPNTTWSTRELAEACVPHYEAINPALKGQLEVRPVPA